MFTVRPSRCLQGGCKLDIRKGSGLELSCMMTDFKGRIEI
jgi:hypothetical protein